MRTQEIELNRGVTEKNVVIRPDPRLGQPGPLAHKIFVALIKKHSNYGRPIQSERWDLTLKQRLRGDTWEKLQPGGDTVVVCPLWDFVKEPGTYRVSWKGKHFQSPEAVLRIVPREPAPSKESGVNLWAAVSVLPPVFAEDWQTVNRATLSLRSQRRWWDARAAADLRGQHADPVDVAPGPLLAGFERADDRVAG